MALTTLSGTVSGIRHSSETSGHIGKNGGNVLDLSTAGARTEIELELRNGFRGRGGSGSN